MQGTEQAQATSQSIPSHSTAEEQKVRQIRRACVLSLAAPLHGEQHNILSLTQDLDEPL